MSVINLVWLLIGLAAGALIAGLVSSWYMGKTYPLYGNLIKAKDSKDLYFMLEVGEDIYGVQDKDLVVLRVKEKVINDLPRDSQRVK